ncbi:Uncharacterized protein PHSC3_000093 [Chlamydiales bacterium STE3]|nr:Uncharacterized protein PHSC3_000093 [Chlamydiales bacterium STE3]
MGKFKYLLLLFIPAYIFIHYIPSKRSDWFNPNFITYEKESWPTCQSTLLDSENIPILHEIFQKPFTFLGSGNQTFAFSSADGKYVLKFFKFQHLKGFQHLHYLPKFSWLKNYQAKKFISNQKRIQQVFSGHFLALTKDRENSGLIYAHLNPQESIPFTAKIIDRNQILYEISLNDVVFVVQKKGVSSNQFFRDLLNRGKVAEVKASLRALLCMYLEEYHLGVYDRDHNVMHNTGFYKNRPIRLDVGKLRYDEEMKLYERYIIDLRKVVWERIDRWMRKYYPLYREEIAKELAIFLNEIALL